MGPARSPRAIILPVVLILIALLSLTMAGFIFFVRAEAEGIMAFTDGQQARLVGESGLEEVIALLREDLHNAAAWYDVPDWHHALVWAEDYERDSDPVEEMGSRRDYLSAKLPRPPGDSASSPRATTGRKTRCVLGSRPSRPSSI
jgi:hypothetical protein